MKISRNGIILALGELIREEESKPGILNVVKLKQMQQTYELLIPLARDTEAEIHWELHEPYKSMGSISLEGEDLIFKDSRRLGKAISGCSNVEIYPLTNGKIRMTLTWLGLVKNLK